MLVRRRPPCHIGSHLWPSRLGECWCAADRRGERESEGGCWWVFSAGLAAHSPLAGLRPWSKSEKPSHMVTSLQVMVLCRLSDGESGSMWASIGERGCLWGLPIIAGGH